MADAHVSNDSETSETPDAQGALEQVSGDLSQLADEAAAAARSSAQPNQPAALNLPRFDVSLSPKQSRAIELLADVNLNVKIELGRTRLLVEDVLKLSEGAVVELDKLAGDPVDVYVNDRHVARGEVLVLNDNFCVRINEILAATVEASPKSSSA